MVCAERRWPRRAVTAALTALVLATGATPAGADVVWSTLLDPVRETTPAIQWSGLSAAVVPLAAAGSVRPPTSLAVVTGSKGNGRNGAALDERLLLRIVNATDGAVVGEAVALSRATLPSPPTGAANMTAAEEGFFPIVQAAAADMSGTTVFVLARDSTQARSWVWRVAIPSGRLLWETRVPAVDVSMAVDPDGEHLHLAVVLKSADASPLYTIARVVLRSTTGAVRTSDQVVDALPPDVVSPKVVARPDGVSLVSALLVGDPPAGEDDPEAGSLSVTVVAYPAPTGQAGKSVEETWRVTHLVDSMLPVSGGPYIRLFPRMLAPLLRLNDTTGAVKAYVLPMQAAYQPSDDSSELPLTRRHAVLVVAASDGAKVTATGYARSVVADAACAGGVTGPALTEACGVGNEALVVFSLAAGPGERLFVGGTSVEPLDAGCLAASGPPQPVGYVAEVGGLGVSGGRSTPGGGVVAAVGYSAASRVEGVTVAAAPARVAGGGMAPAVLYTLVERSLPKREVDTSSAAMTRLTLMALSVAEPAQVNASCVAVEVDRNGTVIGTEVTLGAGGDEAPPRGSGEGSTGGSGGGGGGTDGGNGGNGVAPTPKPPGTGTGKKFTCFPAAATVSLRDGSVVQMDALRLGTPVLAVHATNTTPAVYSPVYFFSHADATAVSPMVRLTTASGAVSAASPGHLLGVVPADGGGPGAPVLTPAAAVVPGRDTVAVEGGARSVVLAVDHVAAAEGLYNPHTLVGSVVVDGVVWSDLTTALPPAVGERLLAPLKGMWAMGGVRALRWGGGGWRLSLGWPTGSWATEDWVAGCHHTIMWGLSAGVEGERLSQRRELFGGDENDNDLAVAIEMGCIRKKCVCRASRCKSRRPTLFI